MKTASIILIVFAALSTPSFAQIPHIDSIAVDEDKGELVLYGDFPNSSSAMVLVDSVALPVVLASDTLIRATIQVSGKGSCGSVNIKINGQESNSQILTYIHFEICNTFEVTHSDASNGWTREKWDIHLRSGQLNSNNNLRMSKISRDNKSAGGQDGTRSKYTGPVYDTTWVLQDGIIYDSKSRVISYGRANVRLDDNYGVIAEMLNLFPNICSQGNCSLGTNGYCYQWYSIAPTDFPPSISTVRESYPIILQTHLSSDPISANAEVIISLHDAMKVRMEILDILGHLKYSDEKMLSAGENKMPINASMLLEGVYICKLQAGSEVMSLRFVKE
jgi:hypothetical protein